MTAFADQPNPDEDNPRHEVVDPLDADPDDPESLRTQRRYLVEHAEHAATLKSVAAHWFARYRGAPRVPNTAGGIDDLGTVAQLDSDGFGQWLRAIVERSGNAAHELEMRTKQLDHLINQPRRIR